MGYAENERNIGFMKKSRIDSVVCVILTLALVFFNFAGLDLGKVEAYAEQQLKGEGTEESPYEISDYDMLKQFSDIVNGRNGYTSTPGAWAKLTANIVCTDELWNPIGWYDSDNNIKYTGHFDGHGYVIKGLSNAKVNGITSKKYQGLFGYNAGEVKDVGLQDTNILGLYYVGGVAGNNNGSITVTGTDGKEQKTDVKTSLKELGLEGKDISEVIEYLLQNIMVKK